MSEHTPRNPNDLHKEEHAQAGLNQRVAIGMTQLFQAMPTFWLITAWILLWILANVTILRFDPLPFPLLLALASIPQLPLMIVIMVGQGVLGRHQELQADEAYKTAVKTLADAEEIKAQNAEIKTLLTNVLTTSSYTESDEEGEARMVRAIDEDLAKQLRKSRKEAFRMAQRSIQ